MEEKIKYVSYVRVSTSEQGVSGLGLQAQKKIIKDYVGDNSIIAEFKEVYTGTDLKSCVELHQAIKCAKKNNAKLIIARSNRFRDLGEAMSITKDLGEGNLVCCDIPSGDELVQQILFAVAQKEAKNISKATMQGIAQIKVNVAKQGYHISKAGNKIKKTGRPRLSDAERKKRAEERILNKDALKKEAYKRKIARVPNKRKLKAMKFCIDHYKAGLSQKAILELINGLYEHYPKPKHGLVKNSFYSKADISALISDAIIFEDCIQQQNLCDDEE